MKYILTDLDTETRPGAQVVAESDNPIVWEAGCWTADGVRFEDPDKMQYAVSYQPSEMDAMTFYLAFTPQERIAIKSSADPVVMEFWQTYQLAVQTGSKIHPNLPSTSGGVAYLRGAGLLASDQRVTDLLLGIPQ